MQVIAEYHRIDLAIEQLEVSLELFLGERSYVSALTLAGAAEEIFGNTLAFSGRENSLRYQYHRFMPVEEFLKGLPKQLLKDFIADKNHVRNGAKHTGKKGEITVIADLRAEALWMIVRACDNYCRLNLPVLDKIVAFEEWFAESVVGVS